MTWDSTKVDNDPTNPDGIMMADDYNTIVSQIKARILHSLSTAENDVLVGSGSNSFVKKTLAEFKTILGLGTAAYTASTAYEPANSNIQSHITDTNNPHAVDKTDVGLGNVDNVAQMPASYLDTDATFASNSDTKVPSQKAVKTTISAFCGMITLPNRAYTSGGINITISENANGFFIDSIGGNIGFSPICSGDETAIEFAVYKSTNRGMFDIYINGVLDSSGYDLYSSSATVSMLSISLTQDILPGVNNIIFKQNGKNGSSAGYIISIYGRGVRLR